MTTNQQNREEWEDVFDNIYNHGLFTDPKITENGHMDAWPCIDDVKQFIRSTRQSAAQEAREEVIEMIKKSATKNKCCYAVEDYIEDLLKQLTTK